MLVFSGIRKSRADMVDDSSSYRRLLNETLRQRGVPVDILAAIDLDEANVIYDRINYSPPHPNIKFGSLTIPYHTTAGIAGTVYVWQGDGSIHRIDMPAVIWQAMDVQKPPRDVKNLIEKLANFKARVDSLNHNENGYLTENVATEHFLANTYYALRKHLISAREYGDEYAVCALAWLDEWLSRRGNTANAMLDDPVQRMEPVWEHGMCARFSKTLWSGYWERQKTEPDFPEMREKIKRSHRWGGHLHAFQDWCRENDSDLMNELMPPALSYSEMGKRSGKNRKVNYCDTDSWISVLQLEYQSLLENYPVLNITNIRESRIEEVRNFNNRLRGFLEHAYSDINEREQIRREILGPSGRFQPPVPGTLLRGGSASEAVLLTLMHKHSVLPLQENVTVHAGIRKTWDLLFEIDNASAAIEFHPDQHGVNAEDDIVDKKKRHPVDILIWGRTLTEVMNAIAENEMVRTSLFPNLAAVPSKDVKYIFDCWLRDARDKVLAAVRKEGYEPARQDHFARIDENVLAAAAAENIEGIHL